MLKNLIKIVIILLVFILAIYSTGGIALAIEQPDTEPTVSNIHANTYLLEEGDILIYGEFNIPYTTIPDIESSASYSFSLLNGDNELGVILPFALMDNGYNKGIFGFYFSADEAPEWGQSYTIRISQNPSQFESPVFFDYELTTSIWTTQTEQEANQTELAINLIMAAQRLDTYYADDYSFLDTSAGGTVLSSPTGETYFRGAIYGIQAMAPELFLVQVMETDTADTSWDTTQADNYTERTSGTWADPDDSGTQFGLSGTAIMGMVFIVPLSIGAPILSSIRFRKVEPGLAASCVFLEVGLLMGWMPPALFATIFQAMGIYLSYVWFLSRG